ncbi:selenoprotein K-like [Artemia franciscana]|uniref:selenoprotein K-like n=1 Tax=Artemia franciscana TaxID=6661 RepID=UPI0032DA3AF0
MSYINSSGQIQNRRPWSLARVTDTFWGFVDAVLLFFQTLFNPGLSKRGSQYASDYRRPGGRPPGPGPNRRMGGVNHNQGPPCPPMGGG